MAKIADIPRSKLVANCVETTLEFLERTEKVGMFQMALMLRDARRGLENLAKTWRERKINDLAT
jgi:hypothetical protein